MGIKDDTPSYLHVPAYKADVHERYIDPSLPPGASLAAPSGAQGREEANSFDALWKAYGYRRGRADARKAYATLAPSEGDHADIVAAAEAWRESWARQNKPDAPRFTLAKWLERECYYEDPPTGYKAKEPKKPKSENLPVSTVSQSEPAPAQEENGDVSMFTPVGTFDAEITCGDMQDVGRETQVDLKLRLRDEVGTVVGTTTHTFYPQAFHKPWQDEGQAILIRLADATGMQSIEDISEIIGKRVRVTIDPHRKITYHTQHEANYGE